MRSRHIRIALALVVVLVMSLSLTGCGGGGGGNLKGHGSMKFAVKFPPLPKAAKGGKYLPSVLMSVVIDILDNTQTGNPPKVAQIVINRPDTTGGTVTKTLTDVPIGDTLINARGYDAVDGGGKLIIISSATCVVPLNDTVSVTLTMDPTAVTIIETGPKSVLVGGNATVQASCTDIDGKPLSSPVYLWTSSDDTTATVTPNTSTAGTAKPVSDPSLKSATVHGLVRGHVTITVKEVVSGVSATLDMDVNPNIDTVTVDPSYQTVNKDKTFDIAAKAYASDIEVTNVPFVFTSEDESVATVLQSGVDPTKATVTGVAGGVTRIDVTQPYTGATGYCNVTVTENGSIDITIK